MPDDPWFRPITDNSERDAFLAALIRFIETAPDRRRLDSPEWCFEAGWRSAMAHIDALIEKAR